MSTAILPASIPSTLLTHDLGQESQREIGQSSAETTLYSYPQPKFSFEPSPAEPILYLPPILSLLPLEYRQPPTPPTESPNRGPHTPLSTESHLPSIDEASLALHHALHRFRAVTPDYALLPYPEAFNWDEIELPEDAEHEWYCVVFNSKRRAGSDGGGLYSADRLAHEEAVQNGGLIMYWYGTPHPKTGMNLATCIWQSRKDAIAANSRPHHIRAMRLAAASYDHYTLKRYWLSKVKGERGVAVRPFEATDT
ncbi:uncharacterized protein C8Q71DRAFT_510071 [Rhodofomes roseus]|uniref:Uncharacterized protein n=1 Tax=Rhodofomes roseus TaxID=34475 RepID=A0A4Y9YMJ9_9APHY|nr:uncharacterized protein C8Q71DRAFT_510071 [Rhodofomes roseus]KAH9839397.1 hypothetical protein C8Q71DRAFT_510071 [Rhodofomes roseus]TFY63160.1 hypothetical protein EVJ58_g3414 [Rhodofomes roseus]